jgi:hypothetical protein
MIFSELEIEFILVQKLLKKIISLFVDVAAIWLNFFLNSCSQCAPLIMKTFNNNVNLLFSYTSTKSFHNFYSPIAKSNLVFI